MGAKKLKIGPHYDRRTDGRGGEAQNREKTKSLFFLEKIKSSFLSDYLSK
jgi:hypothetical protein